MQKLINHPANAVLESLEGFALAYAELVQVHYHPHFVCRRTPAPPGKVAVVSGSGSGHEPLNIGYVGVGMLDVACPGPIFTSPTPDQYSMGVALSGCTSPAVGRPTFQLPSGQIEVGVGIHGEPGRRRALWTKADEIVEMLAAPIAQDLGLVAGERVLALVSGLGGTPQHELFIVYRHLHHYLANLGVTIERRLVGNYITSLDMAGCTVTLLRLDPELLALWDAPVRTPALWW
jgi:dihydroxyacetone kinase